MKIIFGTGPVRIGLLGDVAREAFGKALSEQTGFDVEVRSLPTYAQVTESLRNGTIQLAWMPPALGVKCLDENIARPIAALVRSPQSEYRGALFVRADSRYRSIADLEGARVAWVDTLSSAGYLFPRATLATDGRSLDHFFTSERFVGSHAAVGRIVAAREADVGATFLNIENDELSGQATTAGWADATFDSMRTLVVSDPIPNDLVSAANQMDESARNTIAAALLKFGDNAMQARITRELFGATGFSDVDLSRYEVVRKALLVNAQIGR